MALRKMKNKQIDLSGEKIEAKNEAPPEGGVLDLRSEEMEEEEDTTGSEPLDLRGNEDEDKESDNKEEAVNTDNQEEDEVSEHKKRFLARLNKLKTKTENVKNNEKKKTESGKSKDSSVKSKNKTGETNIEKPGRADKSDENHEVAEIIKEERDIKKKLEKLEHRLEEIETKNEEGRKSKDPKSIEKGINSEDMPEGEEKSEEPFESKESYSASLANRFLEKKIDKDTKIKSEEMEASIDNNDNNKGNSKERAIKAEEGESEESAVEALESNNELKRGKPKEVLEFPPDFLWGTSVSAYQTEGGNNNDWSLWEKGGRRILSLQRQGKQPSEFICGRGVDSYNMWEKDLILAKKLGTNAVRFGLEWSRIESKPNYWNIEAIEHYRELMIGAKKRGLKTFVTLWHWTLPNWAAKTGGWSNKENIDNFLRYVDLIISELGGGVDYWVTLNEPMVHIVNGYINGKFPPGRKNIFKAWRAYRNLIKAHKESYKLIHKHFPNAKVSIAKLHNFYEPARKINPIENALAWFLDYISNRDLLNKIEKYLDYIGFDYYFHDRVVWHPPFIKNKNLETTDIGWEIYPYGIYRGLKKLSRYNKPIYILENGLADAKDEKRENFIKDHLAYVHQALEEGIDVRGYFHWSLLDNFEWDKGFEPKFGLYEVDRKTMKRSPRPSALAYKEICKTNKVEIEE